MIVARAHRNPFTRFLPALCAAALVMAPSGHAAAPTLRADTAVYNLEQGVLQYAFTFANPSDSVLFLDCQVPPRAAMSGSTLVLDFDRKAIPDSNAPPADGKALTYSGEGNAGGTLAGGPLAGKTVDPNDFPPQRIGAQQTFQGQRRLDRVLGDYQARPKFSSLQLRMAYYPERASGEGEPFVIEQQRRVTSRIVTVVRRGKVPPPPRVLKHRVPAPG